MVEQLLELLVRVVDAELFERVELQKEQAYAVKTQHTTCLQKPYIHVYTHSTYAAHLKDLETSDIQNANKLCTLTFRPIKRLIDPVHEPLEHTLIAGLRNRLHRELSLDKQDKSHETYITCNIE